MASRDYDKEIAALRKENGDRRTELKRFKEAFSGWDTGQVEYLLSVITLMGDPESREEGYRELHSLTETALRVYDGEPEPEPDPEPDTPDEPEEETPDMADKTEEEIRAELRKEMEAEMTKERTNIQIDAEARALGYEPGSSGFAVLMHHAARLEGGDTLSIKDSLSQAHVRVLEDIGQIIPKEEAAEEEVVDDPPAPKPEFGEGTPRFSPSAQAGGSGGPVDHPDSQEKPLDWASARTGFEEFLESQDNQPVT